MTILCPNCSHEDRRIEASSRIYFDITAGDVKDGKVTIAAIELSSANDMLGDMALNIGAELRVSCAACGHEYDSDFSDELRNQLARNMCVFLPQARHK